MGEQTNIGTLAEQVGVAARELQALEVERETLPKLIEQAAEEADAEALVKARRRFDEIDTYIHAASVRHARLKLTLIEAQLEEAESERVSTAESLEPFKASFEAARAEYDAAKGRAGNAKYTFEDLRRKKGEAERYLQNLMKQVSGPQAAPVVRSLWHAA